MADTEFSFSTVVISVRILQMFCFLSIFHDTRIKFSITIISIYGIRGRIQYGGWFQFFPYNKWRLLDVTAIVVVYVLANLSDTLYFKYFSF